MTGTALEATTVEAPGFGVTETTGILTMAFIFGVPVTLALALLLTALYRRSVEREMNRRSVSTSLAPPPRARATSAAGRDWSAPWQSVRRRSAGSYVVGGLVYSLTGAALLLRVGNLELLPFRTLLVATGQAWPFVLLVALFFATRHERLVLFIGYFALLLVPSVVSDHWYDPLIFWAANQGAQTLLIVGFLWYRLRAVGPFLLAFVMSALMGGNTGLLWLSDNVESASTTAAVLGAPAGLVVGFAITAGALLAVVVGIWFSKLTGRLYAQARLGDQEITAHALVFTFGLFLAIDLVFAGKHAAFFLLGLVPFCLYVGVSRLLRPAAAPVANAPELLFLRVFAKPSTASRLWSVLGKSWRYLGSVTIIGGPDLATSTLAPHRFFDWLGGKFARHFVHDITSLGAAVAAFDERRDRDGRLAVNELYCRDDTWRAAFARLVGESDVILMDLRGFQNAESGVAFELGVLASSGAIGRSVLIVDGTTQEALIDRTLASSAPGQGGTGRRLRTSGDVSETALMNALFEAAGYSRSQTAEAGARGHVTGSA